MEQNQTRKQYRRALAEAGEKKIIPGVYKVTNDANGKIFVGSGPNLAAKWNAITFQLNQGSVFMNKGLQEDWNRYGAPSFRFEILAELKIKEGEAVDMKKELAGLEEMWLEELRPYGERGYNKPPAE